MKRSISLLCNVAAIALMSGMSFAEEKQITDEKQLENIKYPIADLTQKVKFYKHITSGISLRWFIEESLLKKGTIKYFGKSDYCIALTSGAYPGLVFTFSSKTQKPLFSRFDPIHNQSDYKYMGRYLDLNGALFEVQISLPKKIDQRKVYAKLCKDYSGIKPTFKKEDRNKPVGGCVLKTKGGRYIWSNDKIYASFTFADYAGVTGSNQYVVNMLKQEGQKFGVRKILIQDKILHNRLVTVKKNKDMKAANAAQDAALDF